MSLKSKIEAVIYASEEPVTLQQLVGLLAGEAQAELDELAAKQAALPLDGEGVDPTVVEAGAEEPDELDAAVAEALEQGEVVGGGEGVVPAAPESGEVVAAEAEPAATEDAGAEAEGEPVADAPADDAAEDDKKKQRERERAVREYVRRICDQLIREYAESDRGIEIREVASGFRMGTKPEYHDAVRGFVKSLKPALKLTLPALETLAVVAYKQPVTAAEISEIRGVDSAGVLGGLMTRKLIATAGRKQVIGRPMLYKTTRDFLLRFGLKDIQELPSMEEFERMAGELAEQEDLPMEGTDSIIEQANARGDAEMLKEEASQQAGEPAGQRDDDGAATEETDAVAAAEELNETGEAEEAASYEQEKATAESAAGGEDEEVREEQPVEGDESNSDEVDEADGGEGRGEEEHKEG